jgi:tetratricopeptide (TPR) repeat protein
MSDTDMSQFWRVSSSSLPISDLSGFSYRSIPKLPPGEHKQFVKAWRLLDSGGILAMARDGDMALAGTGVCEALLARSWAARYHDPDAMLRLASAAQVVAAGLKTNDLGMAGVAAMQARALGEMANALRVAGRVDEAEEVFEQAFDREDDFYDPHLASHLLQMRATLYGRTGDPAFAVTLLGLVIRFYDEQKDTHLGGRARIAQSIYVARAGEKEAALELNLEGLKRVDRERDPALVMAALHNRLLLLLKLGRKEEARETARSCAGFDTAGPVALRLRWLEGTILQSLGELEDAEQALRQSRDGLSALGLKVFTAMASLDLSATLLLQDRFQEAQTESSTAEKILLGLENRKEFFPALLLLEAAFSSGDATVEKIQGALAILRNKMAGS